MISSLRQTGFHFFIAKKRNKKSRRFKGYAANAPPASHVKRQAALFYLVIDLAS